jgi:chromosome partitioning protein
LKGDGFQDYGILLTRVDGRKTRTNSAVLEALGPWMSKVFKTVIPQSEPLNQAQMARQDIYHFDPTCAGAEAYRALTQEILDL